MHRPPLARQHDDRVLGGVAAGLAIHLGVSVAAVRAAFVVTGLLGGAGVLMYAWLWSTVPWAESEHPPMRRALTTEASPLFRRGARIPLAELALGTGLLLAGIALVLTQFGVHLPLEMILPGMAVLVGVGLTWWQIADRKRPERNQVPRVLAALSLVAVGVLMFFVTARQPNAWTVIAAAIAVLAGVALAIAPWLLRITRELADERAAHAREAERAEIAAHLHDSVLQTLALIQQRSAPGSDIDRLARGQERELREWLFRAADGAEPDTRVAIEQELRAHAEELEARYAVRFEIIAVGTARAAHPPSQQLSTVPEALAAAAKEAMLNAAKHAGGNVTVYVELTAAHASVDILDRGPGVDLAAIAEGRMGVRESILGRMERAGGTAEIKEGPGQMGTSVRLRIPLVTEVAATSSGDGRGKEHR